MKATKRILSLILAVAMLLSFAPVAIMAEETVTLELTDLDGVNKETAEAVKKLVSLGIINGYEDSTFRPNNAITRAEFSVIMVRFEDMEGNINPDAMTGFADLDMDPNYAWARPYVAIAVQRGIINGFEDGTFRAKDPVTYDQAIKMLVCSLGYGESAKTPTIPGDWASGYIQRAFKLGLTANTSINERTLPTTRGVVAVLVNNALNATAADITDGNNNLIIEGGDRLDELGYEDIKGIVTGTFFTSLEYEDGDIPRNHIQIDDEIYEIGFSRTPNDFLGCRVKAVIEDNDDGDYPKVVKIEATSGTDVNTVNAGFFGQLEDGVLEYKKDKDGSWKKQRIDEDYIIIFNNKLYDDESLEDIIDDLKTGSIDFVDNNGDNKADVIRVSSYETYIVASKNSTKQTITPMYDALYDGENEIVFPGESTSLVFSLTRNGKEIKFNEINKWDVLNIKRSPEDADGKKYYEVIVTRKTASGNIEETEVDDLTYITINNEKYPVSEEYEDYQGDDKVVLDVNENVQVYIDAFGRVVAAAKTSAGDSEEAYAYMWGVRQDDDNSDYDLEFWLYTIKGKELKIGAADKIKIDGVKYKALDDDVLEVLSESAEKAHSGYQDATYLYHQPIVYQTNSEGLISVIHTVNSEDNEKISMTMENEDGDTYHVGYKERTYSSSSKSFTDFKVSSSTKIVFVPDNRGNTDDYLLFTSYAKAFSNARKYHVEAFGLSKNGTANLVLLYKENDSRIYTSSSPWMIVASKSITKDGAVIKGYKNGTSYSLSSVTVSEEDGPSITGIGKGDIIRYIVDGKNELVGYQMWFDASDPAQLEPINDIRDAYAEDSDDIQKRIIEIHSTNTEPRYDYPNATFRLQYGTVTDIYLKSEGESSLDDQYIAVSPYILEDETEIEMDSDDTGFINEEIGSSVKVFSYDRSGRGSEVVADASLSEILDYTNYEDDATRVIVYTGSSSLRMIYIIHE